MQQGFNLMLDHLFNNYRLSFSKRMNKKFKKAVGQIHLWLGLATGLVVVIISITGCLYVFEKEIRDFIQRDYKEVPLQNGKPAGLSAIVESFEKNVPKEKITTIRIINKQPNASVIVETKKEHAYYFNPYNGALIRKTNIDWLDTVEDIHRTLLLGEVGKFIIHWSVVIFVIMLITGFVLWFPNQMRLLKQSLTIKWGASVKRVNYDLHNVLGFYASWILIIIALSGLYFAFKGVKSAASFITGTKLSKVKEVSADQPVAPKDLPARYQQFYDTAANDYPGAETTTIAIRKTGEIRVRMLYPYTWERRQNVFFFDVKSGKLLNYKLYKDNTAADKLEATNYDLHTGQLFGLFGKIVACLASLISASLPITGFIIWLKKQKKSKKKQYRKMQTA